MKALFIYADPDGPFQNTSHYRILIPARYLRLAGHDIETVHRSQISFESIPEVVLVERTLTSELVSQLRMAGAKRIIATFDDHYGQAPFTSDASLYWRGAGGNLKDFRAALSMADLAIVPSEALAREYSRSAEGRIAVVENFLDPSLWIDSPRWRENCGIEKPRGKLVIGWGGSNQHSETWKQTALVDALRVIVDRHGDKVAIRTYGSAPRNILLRAGVEYQEFASVPFNVWPRHISAFDIGLAPLAGSYDQYRSNLKCLEYGLMGIPFVASSGGPYNGMSGGFLVGNRYNQWVSAIERLIHDPTLRDKLGSEGEADSMPYLMDRHVADYEKILWD